MVTSFANAAERAHTAAEEVWHVITHGLGIVLAVIALVFLVLKATDTGGALEITAVSIYGGSAVLLYLASTIYHAAFKSVFQPFLEVVDHAAIYLKIAGSYTPFALITLPTGTGLAILITVWTLAAVGIVLKFVLHFAEGSIRKYDWLSLAGYVGMGWIAILVAWPLFKNLSAGGFAWLVAGGLCFTVGAGFFAWKSKRYTHAIFHVFVLAGSVCHFVAIYAFVLGDRVAAA
jgi:hemolysin III